MSGVNTKHPDYEEQIDAWVTVRDAVAGDRAIKASKERYLPKPNPEDRSEYNAIRYKQYLQRAVWYGVTGRTLDGLVGQAYAKPPVIEIPALLGTVAEDIDGAGLTIEQQSQRVVRDVLSYGRSGLFVDYPPVQQSTSRADLEAGRIRPTIVRYRPHDIINWRTMTVGAQRVLSMVVLEESYVAESDGFEDKTEAQWRVLRLEAETGFYRVEIWRKVGDVEVEVERYYPLDAGGNNLTEIPFTFVGSENNDWRVDKPPLYDIAVVNIAHYRNSADYEESCYMVGQPTPYLTGITDNWKEAMGSVALGTRTAIALPPNATAGLLQAAPNSMPMEAMQAKERQMVALGARLVEQREVQRTATEARQSDAANTSVLATAVGNVSAAYTWALERAAEFAGATGPISFEISQDFAISGMTAEERAQLIAEWQGGAITFEEMRDGLRRANVAYLPDEEAKDVLEGMVIGDA